MSSKLQRREKCAEFSLIRKAAVVLHGMLMVGHAWWALCPVIWAKNASLFLKEGEGEAGLSSLRAVGFSPLPFLEAARLAPKSAQSAH